MKRRAFTLVEVLTGLSVLSVVMFGTVTLLTSGLKSFKRTMTDVGMTNENSLALRRISETLRQSINVSISGDGKTVSFNLPKVSGVDAITGEKELADPVVSDGIARSFTIDSTNKVLLEYPSKRVLVRNISATDPQVGSSQYGKSYTPFQLTTFGSYRAVTINLITSQKVVDETRYMRMKTTAVVRNAK